MHKFPHLLTAADLQHLEAEGRLLDGPDDSPTYDPEASPYSVRARAGRVVELGLADLRITPAGLVAAVVGAVPNPEEVELVGWLALGPVRASTSWNAAQTNRTAPGVVLGKFADAGLAQRHAKGEPYTATPRCCALSDRIDALREAQRRDEYSDRDAEAGARRATGGG